MARCPLCASVVIMTENRSSGPVGSCWECGATWDLAAEKQHDPHPIPEDADGAQKGEQFIVDWALCR